MIERAGPRMYRLLDDHSIELVEDFEKWVRQEGGAIRRVAFDEVSPGVAVSTIFLGIDHSFRDRGAPLIFETMVFTDYGGDEQLRWRTWSEAMAGHDLTVARHRKIVDELQALRDLPDDQIDTSDIPEVTDWSKATRGPFKRK